MTFDWRDYFQLACRLAEGTADDAAKRAAISRAYYAAYNMTRLYLRIMANSANNMEGSHGAVWGAADRDPREQVKLAGKKGWKLKQRRELADYEPRMSDLNYRLAESLELARQILNLLYPPEPVSTPDSGAAPAPSA